MGRLSTKHTDLPAQCDEPANRSAMRWQTGCIDAPPVSIGSSPRTPAAFSDPSLSHIAFKCRPPPPP